MNLENKKQIMTIAIAVALGLVAALLMANHINNSVREQTQLLAQEYQKKSAALMQQIDMTNAKLAKTEQRQAQLERQLQEVQLKPAQVVQATGQPGVSQGVVPMESFALRTPPGKRAFTILIDSLSAVGGLVNAGDYIDILAHLQIPKKPDDTTGFNKVTTVLFQRIQVLAVGTNFKPIGAETQYALQQQARSLLVTLAVTPEEATLLTFAQSHGSLQLSLRSPGEDKTEQLQVASWEALSDFVSSKQGTELLVPKKKTETTEPEQETTTTDDTEKPDIQIFKSGKETSL